MKNTYSKLPNNLVFGLGDEKSLFQIAGDEKVLLILDYLCINTNRKDISKFTLEDMIIECGLKPDTRKGRSNSIFKSILKQLQDLKIIICDVDLSTIKPTQFVKCELDMFEKNEERRDIRFFQLDYDIKDKIMQQDIEKGVSNAKLLLYYCYINARISKRKKDESQKVAEVLWADYDRIIKDLGFGRDTIAKYNEILVKLDLIRIDNAGQYYAKEDKAHTLRESCNIYCLYNENWKYNLKEGIKQYKLHKGDAFVFTGKKEKDSTKTKTIGFISRINYLEKEGKANLEQIKKRDKLLEQINTTDEQYTIRALLNNPDYEDMLLSDLLIDQHMISWCFKYNEIEQRLELVDSEGELLVDYEYYRWVMLNYKPEQHEFYYNCIKKHKKESTPLEMYSNKNKNLSMEHYNTNKVEFTSAFGGYYKDLNKKISV